MAQSRPSIFTVLRPDRRRNVLPSATRPIITPAVVPVLEPPVPFHPPEHWNLAVDGKKWRYEGRTGRCLLAGHDSDLLDCLFVPKFVKPIATPPHRPLEASELAAIIRLPMDILDIIFDHLSTLSEDPLENVAPLAAFCMSCSTIWSVGERHFRLHMKKIATGALVSRKLAIIGDKCPPKDPPLGFFDTPEDAEEYFAHQHGWSRGHTRTPKRNLKYAGSHLKGFFNHGELEVQTATMWAHPGKSKWRVLGFRKQKTMKEVTTIMVKREEVWKHEKYEREHLKILLAGTSKELLFALDEKWVLRDLDTFEFVRAEALAGNPSQLVGPQIKSHAGFGALLAVRTSWSTSTWLPPYGETHGALGHGSFRRGMWAGHRFDIVTDDEVAGGQQDVSGKTRDWIDVSDEAVKELEKIGTIEYGEKWKQIVDDHWYERE